MAKMATPKYHVKKVHVKKVAPKFMFKKAAPKRFA